MTEPSDAKLSEEQVFWDNRYSDGTYIFGTEPNAFLKRSVEKLRPAGKRALTLADGEGRNGVWLAGQGYEVDSVDFSPNAAAKAQKLATARGVSLNIEVGDVFTWEGEAAAYDLVALIFVQFASPEQRVVLFDRARHFLKPGGWLLIEGYGLKQLEYRTGGPGIAEKLYTPELLAESFADFEDVEVADYDAEIAEGTHHTGLSALVDFTGRKPGA